MNPVYRVKSFIPKINGCGASDNGWDIERCDQFSAFLNTEASEGWKLHSYEYREVKNAQGCGSTKGAWLVCVFEKLA